MGGPVVRRCVPRNGCIRQRGRAGDTTLEPISKLKTTVRSDMRQARSKVLIAKFPSIFELALADIHKVTLIGHGKSILR